MKTPIILILLLSIALANYAQSTNFLRVYDKHGKKFAKGRLSATTDSSIILKKETKSIEVPYTIIGYMRTKRSTGHNILVSSLLVGGISSAFVAIASNSSKSTPTTNNYGYNIDLNKYFKPDDTSIGLLFLVSGATLGAPIGGLIGATKKTERFNINGNKEEWKKVKVILDRKINYTAVNH